MHTSERAEEVRCESCAIPVAVLEERRPIFAEQRPLQARESVEGGTVVLIPEPEYSLSDWGYGNMTGVCCRFFRFCGTWEVFGSRDRIFPFAAAGTADQPGMAEAARNVTKRRGKA